MLMRTALRFGVAVALVLVALAFWRPMPFWKPHPSTQGSPAQNAPAGAPPLPITPPQNPEAAPPPVVDTPDQPGPAEGINTRPGDPFGVETALNSRLMVYVKGSSAWDKAFPTISSSLKKVEAYMAKEGLKADGMPMTIFTATDDNGFDYEVGVPISAPPKNPLHGEIVSGQSPDGRALEFIHRGSYDAMDDTYEAITNYLDEKRLESRNILVEQYVTDPASADEKNLVVNVFVLIK
jgi:effector-binding domain-containing protein